MSADHGDRHLPDSDPVETREWLDSVDAVVESDGRERMGFLLDQAIDHAQDYGVKVSAGLSTPYVNTIPVEEEPELPGDPELERLATALVRWNAIAIVLQANAESTELGGHIASYQSAETLYEVGFNHFWRARSEEHGGDLVYMQGHSSPGHLRPRLPRGPAQRGAAAPLPPGGRRRRPLLVPAPVADARLLAVPDRLDGARPADGDLPGAVPQVPGRARHLDPGDRKVWAFMGDGEMDEPESMGAISLAGREKLDNLVFVVNCNLQRLDGPVRGNGKIIQELETNFRGAGWNVIKVIWGSSWDPLLEADETRDAPLPRWRRPSTASTRRSSRRTAPTFASTSSASTRRRARWSPTGRDEEIWALRRGGHDPRRSTPPTPPRCGATGQPTVILAKTIKGFGMGEAGEGRNITHQQKSMNEEARLAIRDRLGLPLTDEQATGAFFHRPPEDSPELRYLLERRAALGGSLPARRHDADPLPTPAPFTTVLEGSGERENSTTMAFVRILNSLVRDPALGERIVPIVPDESRTFGMEGMFRQLGIFSQVGQLYQPEDAEDFMFYREDEHGQILQEGINEPGAFSSWIAAATSYANHGVTMVPFYIFYSMFGFQRVGDLAWAAGDSRARGFLIGATAGRTTLNGEGLQHEDGHSHLLASVVPELPRLRPDLRVRARR